MTWNKVSPIPANGPIIPVFNEAKVSTDSIPFSSCNAQSNPKTIGAIVLFVLKNCISTCAAFFKSSSFLYIFLINGKVEK